MIASKVGSFLQNMVATVGQGVNLEDQLIRWMVPAKTTTIAMERITANLATKIHQLRVKNAMMTFAVG